MTDRPKTRPVGTTIGIIGAGEVGSQIARAAVSVGYQVVWRDGNIPVLDSGEKTVHELRQEQLPTSKVAKAFTDIQAPRLLTAGRPAGAPDRLALSVSSDFPDAVALVTRLYDQFGFDTVDNSPLSESWRSGPGQPVWLRHAHQNRDELIVNLSKARRVIPG
ncbi:NADPH-dependent F420 reductase [Solwaraspora sp. WMMB762]|uniref:NADPH-dependent F420 reductase n=1 Tax=Solwaraspora sp. WMMB762 TaxID=3404120 RepID=UPI003B963196